LSACRDAHARTCLDVTHRLILASASAARLRVLRGAGLDPRVVVSGVDEGGTGDLTPAQAVLTLARRKAAAVAALVPAGESTLVMGCDSLLEFDGRAEGKPATVSDARALWRRLRRRTGKLHTGHCLIHTGLIDTRLMDTGLVNTGLVNTGRAVEAGAPDTALIRFGDPTDGEIDAYVATGEPLRVAGGFTLEGFGSAWIDSIDGNPGTVMGLSIPVLRRLTRELGLEIVDFWAPAPSHHA
jgi:septum formation protein